MKRIKGYRKEKVVYILILFMLAGLIIPLISTGAEQNMAYAASEDNVFSSANCPHKGSPETIAELGCFTCGGSGVNWDGAEYVKKHGGKFSGNTIKYGNGWQTKETVSGDTKTVAYYRCKNCGDTGYDCIEFTELIKTEHYELVDGNWVLDTLQGVNGVVTPSDPASASQGWVPRRWCSHCGPELYDTVGMNQCYTDATWAQWHYPNNAEITLDFTDTNGNAIAKEEVLQKAKGESFAYTAPSEMEQEKTYYELLDWTCEDAEGNNVQGNGTPEVKIDKVSSDTYYIRFIYQQIPVLVEAEATATLGEDYTSVNGSYRVQTDHGDFEKVRVGWARNTAGTEATITFQEVAKDTDSTSGEMSVSNAVEGAIYYLVIEVTTRDGTRLYYSNGVEIPVPDVTGSISLSAAEDYKSVNADVGVSVKYADYSQIKVSWYEKADGETGASGSTDTLTTTAGNSFTGSSTKGNAKNGYTYSATLVVTVKGKTYSFESNQIAIPVPKVSGNVQLELSGNESEIFGTASADVLYAEYSKIGLTWFEKALNAVQFTATESDTLASTAGTSYFGPVSKSGLKPGYTYQALLELTVNGKLYSYSSNKIMVPTPMPVPTLLPSLTPTPPPSTYLVSMVSSPEGAGMLTGAGSYHAGDKVTLSAVPNPGYLFLEWRPSTSLLIENNSFQMPAENIGIQGVFVTPTPAPTSTPTPTPTPSPTPTPVPHVCVFGEWVWDTTNHWKECDCGKIEGKEKHTMITGTPDDTGLTEHTCKECGYSYTAHKHNYLQWCPEDIWDDTYDPFVYHWKICEYDTCGKVTGRAVHQATIPEYIDNGNGWLEKRCKTCNWLMDSKPVTVTLTLHPNGGTFPDGSTDQIVFENIQYNQATNLWKLSSDYFPERDGKNFSGYYIIDTGTVACMYEADYDDFTCTGTSGFFVKQANGTYISRLTKDYVVYAQYRNASYTVNYHGNGANGVMYPSNHDVGVSKALSQNSYYFTSHISYNTGGMSGSIDTTLSNTQVAAKMTGWATTPDGEPLYEDQQVVLDLLRHGGDLLNEV